MNILFIIISAVLGAAVIYYLIKLRSAVKRLNDLDKLHNIDKSRLEETSKELAALKQENEYLRSQADKGNQKSDVTGININLGEDIQESERLRLLAESNIQMQLALETSENGFADIQLDKNKVFFSPIFAKLLGYNAEELNNHFWNWQNTIHAEELPLVKEAVSLIMNKKQSSAEFTHRVLTKTGHWRWFLTKIKVAAKDEHKNPLRLLIIVEDVSLRKKAEEEMFINLAKERELAETRSRLITLVSHEFRTPISTILSSVELMENYWNNLSKEKLDNYFGKIKKSVDYLVSFLNEISLMSKAENNALTFKPEEVEVISYLEELIDEIKTVYRNHPGIHFNTNRKHFKTSYDKQLLRYIFDNLLSNAIKYTPSDKNVYVYCILNPTEFFFSITDEGIGIPKEEQKKLFDPFTRASNVGEIKGTGLGLSIVKKTVEVCRGKISFESSVQKGTCFKVILPLSPSVN